MDLVFILVEPAVAENIGAAARAIKTMGFEKLWLVRPKANRQAEKALMLAHGSHEILEKSAVFENLESAVRELDLAVGTTSKGRKTHTDYLPGDRLPALLKAKYSTARLTGIVFGSEETGLTNEQLRQCDVVSSLPISKPYPSLNLAQAVMLYAYILSPLRETAPVHPVSKNMENLRSLKEKAATILNEVEITNREIIGPRILERISYLEDEDIRLAHSYCNAFIKKFSPRKMVKTAGNRDIPGKNGIVN